METFFSAHVIYDFGSRDGDGLDTVGDLVAFEIFGRFAEIG
jgi:hypothetical protein